MTSIPRTLRMKPPVAVAALLAFSGVLLAAGPAAALDGGCLWSSLSPERRQVFQQAIDSGDLNAASALGVSAGDVAGWTGKCGYRPDLREQAEGLLAARVFEQMGVAGVARATGLTEAALAAQWDGMDPTARARLVKIGGVLVSGRDPEKADSDAVFPAMKKAIQNLGATTGEGPKFVASYLTGRAMRAAVEQAKP